MRAEDIKFQYSKPPAGTEWAVFITRTTTEVVEVRVPHAELDYAHNPDSVDELRAAVTTRAMEKNVRGETSRIVGPVRETETTTWDMVGPAADRSRANLINLYSGDDTPDAPEHTETRG